MFQPWIFLAYAFALAQATAGFFGIALHLGPVVAGLAVLALLRFGLTIPLAIGAYFGASAFWAWPWYGALAFAAVPVLSLIPCVLDVVYERAFGREAVRRR